MSGWELLKLGEYSRAIDALKKESDESGEMADLGNLGIAYLCAGNFMAAKDAFDRALAAGPRNTGTYAARGVCRWLLNERAEGVRVWEEGLDSPYADAAGGMELPLLLFYAGTREPSLYDASKAHDMIGKLLTSPRAINWPAPLGQFIIGKIDERELRSKAVFTHEIVTRQQTAQVEFYVGLLALTKGDQDRFRQHMERAVSVADCEAVYERYLAMHELRKLAPSTGGVGGARCAPDDL